MTLKASCDPTASNYVGSGLLLSNERLEPIRHNSPPNSEEEIMRGYTKILSVVGLVASLTGLAVYARAQHGPGFGPGMMGMMGMRHGSATMSERQEIHDMFMLHDRIKRTVANLPNGIRTVTESDDPELAATIASHVAGMLQRVNDGRDPKLPIQSPTLEIIFRNKDKITTTVEATEKGVAVVQTSADAETVRALQKHASEVSDLAKRGMVAAHEGMRGRH
jgi:hypothetical protein